MIKIVLLSTYSNPLLPLYLKNLLNLKGIIICGVVLDQKNLTEYQVGLLQERFPENLMVVNHASFEQYHVPYYFVKNHNAANAVNLYHILKPDFLINCGTPRILKDAVLKSSQHGILNVHPGVLPKYRGCSAVEWSIYNGDLLGNTIHLMSQGIDEGTIIKIRYYIPKAAESYKEIRTNMYLEGAKLAADALYEINEGLISQDDFCQQKEGSYWKPIDDDKFNIVKEKIKNGDYLRAIQYKHEKEYENAFSQ